ncbi:prepilin-type N-terminal cleavage/methylation domain-containing protein [bacterium]|nr:prepilin-type N-terminal cleavage/methylation domain-containing protein [bacterium]
MQFSASRKIRAFTLMEILIVAALISLFSSLAIFSTQYLVDSSKRKSSVADARTIAHVLSMAYMDFGIFPKVGYLTLPQPMIERRFGTNQIGLPPDFDALGQYAQNAPQGRTITENWIGPYLPSSLQRQVIAPGYTGYHTTMRIPTPDAYASTGAGSYVVLDWPADPWGNPYVVYLIRMETNPDGTVELRWLEKPTESPNFLAAVVSYGKNGIPGGPSNVSEVTPAMRNDAEAYKIYSKYAPADAEFQALDDVGNGPDQYNATRLSGLHNAAGWQKLGFNVDGYLSQYGIPGIMDPGSDDVVFVIP